MLSSLDKLVAWILAGLLDVLTVFFNTFLLLLNQRRHRQQHKLNPADAIISAIALAAVTQQLLNYLWETMDDIDIVCRVNLTEAVLLVFIFSVKLTLLWSTAYLVFYYAAKLLPGAGRGCGRVRAELVGHVHLLLLLILLAALANCLPLISVLTSSNATTDLVDCGSLMPGSSAGLAYVFYYVVISDLLPAAVMVKSGLSIALHLLKHLRSMRAGGVGPKPGSQTRVIRMTLTLVAVFLLFVVVDVYTQMTVVLGRENTLALTMLFSSIYTSVTSLVLVYGKKSYWTELIASYNLALDQFPGLRRLKVKTGAETPEPPPSRQ